MSVVLRVGAVHPDSYARDGGYTDVDSYDDGSASEDYRPPLQSFPGCFGLPYQDHNYGAPPPASPPRIPSPSSFVDRINGHIEVEEISVTSVGQQASVDVTSDTVDDSITRCICDFTHDDGYMICCDKCSVWQHIDCMAVERSNIPESYFCELCDPRPLDREKARQIQLRKREFILAMDSSTDTDPEEPANRRMAQDMGNRKGKSKKRTKTLKSKDEKIKKTKKEKRDVKKEKENKDLSKRLRINLKEKDSVSKKTKNKAVKKAGLLSLIINENAQQDPWDSSHSPWVDKYEEARENQYSADMQAILGLKKLNGSLNYSGNFNYKRNGRLLVQLCHVTEVSKNRKGLEASETIGEGEPIIEYTGNVMLREQFDKANFYKRLNPFVLFNSMFDNTELCIDATNYGNIARFIRRSCKSNAEVRHTFEDGELTFIVVSTKVIPRGSEITIPYDYNYKECTYCVECACLRNNCPVAKYFKRKQNAQNKKEKVVPKNSVKALQSPTRVITTPVKVINHQPKSPATSLPRSPIKSPIRKSISVEEPVIKEEPEDIKPEIPLPPPPISPVKEVTKEERPPEVKEEVAHDHSTDSGTDHHDTHSESEENPSTERTRRLSREDRKMEAIMKAFEKMEKRQERRKEALARIEQSRKPSSYNGKQPEESTKKEKPKVKNQQEPKESRRTSERLSKAEEVKNEKAKATEKVESRTEVEEPVSTPAPHVKKETKISHKKKKKSSSKRKSRINSSNIVKSEPQSQDESSNTVPSCPLTPVSAPPDPTNTPPSFKFLKTKKHLMNEWLSEKSSDGVLPLPPPTTQPSKTEPLEVQVEDDFMYVHPRPSPRNSLDHMRRNSHSSGSSPYSIASSSKPSAENSIGSAKKRWLRQAMFDRPLPGGQPRSMSPLGLIGGTSPNPSSGLPSPGGSPPGDYITPLKKRRLASYRESMDLPPTSTPAQDVVSSAPEDQSDEIIDVQNTDPVSSEGEMVSSGEKGNSELLEKLSRTVDPSSSTRSSVESISSDNYLRTSSDSRISDTEVSADEGDKVSSNLESSNVTSNLYSLVETSNECDSRQEIDSVNQEIDLCDNSSSKNEAMEVDSTQNDSCQELERAMKKQAVCDSTCKVEDNRACSSSQSITVELSLVDSSSDVNSSVAKQSETVEIKADSVNDNFSEVEESLPLENVGSSSDRAVINSNFDVSSSSESHRLSSDIVESSQVTDSVNVSSTEQTCNSFRATSNLEGGMADSSMSDHKIDLVSDMGVADVSGIEDSTQFVNNISAIESVGEPVASSSMAEDSGISLEPSTPQEQPPTKKKVSLLEYRKRLKEKAAVTTSTPSTSKPSSSTVTAPSSTTSPIHRHHRFSTLPSLPLFDSSPTKENTSRYHFKSSSDLIRRKSTETVREKRPQLSLSERLRMEFGLDDSEEEKEREGDKDSKHSHRKALSSSSHIPPPPPPPPPSKQEPSSAPVSSSAQQPPIFQHPSLPPPMLRGPSPSLVQNGPQGLQPNGAPGPSIMTNINGGSGHMGPSSVLPPNGSSLAPHMLLNGSAGQGMMPHTTSSSPGGKPIPSLLSIKTFPSLNMPNGNDCGTVSSGMDQQNMFHQKNPGVTANHMNKSPPGYTPPSADQFSHQGGQSSSQTPPMYNLTPNGTTHQPSSQSSFNGANMPSNGPIVHDYNHGYSNTDEPVQKNYQSQNQRKKSKKFKRKHFNSYQDSGGGSHYH